MVTGCGIGQAEQALRDRLAVIYFTLLNDAQPLPDLICFYAEGVKLVTAGSPILAALQTLESKGVHLVVCKTCLDYYGFSPEVGIVGGMTDIIEIQAGTDKVVTL